MVCHNMCLGVFSRLAFKSEEIAWNLGRNQKLIWIMENWIIGFVSQNSRKSSSSSWDSVPQNPSNPRKTTEVNTLLSTMAEKSSKCKNKGKGKSKYDAAKQDSPKPHTNDGTKSKLKYPCLICDDEHYTMDSPQWTEVSHLLKGTQGTLAVLK